MSNRRRVYQVAKEFNISNNALISFLLKSNFHVKNHMSPVTDEMYEEICKRYRKETVVSDADYEFRKKLKEKRAQEEAKKAEARRELEERLKASVRFMAEKPIIKPSVAEVVSPAQASKEVSLEPPVSEIAEVKELEKEETVIEEEVPSITEVTPPHPVIEEQEEKTKPPSRKALEEKIEELEKISKIEKTEAPKTEEKIVEEKVAEELTDEELEKRQKKKKKKKKKKKPEERVFEKVIQKVEEDEEGAEKRKKKKKKKKKKKVKFAKEKEAEVKEKAKKKAKKKKKPQISEEEVEEAIRQTFAMMEEPGKHKKKKKKVKESIEKAEEDSKRIKVNEFISVAELAMVMGVEPNEVIRKCLELGLLVSINQRLDMDTIHVVADEFGYEVEILPEYGIEKFEQVEEYDDEKLAESRPPVVTIMGHVDHGKTSLLDYIRESNIIYNETGGITQHIGAYEVPVDGKSITFLDTPGHEAFTAMRARGAQVTDIVILVVAADESVMPQTIEAIDHAKAAGVPIIVAINKIDKPNSNPELIKKQLAENGVLVESWGGKYQSVELSAKTGEGVGKLLERIILEAEMLELKANPHRPAKGVVIESKLDKGKGVVATVLVQKGTLKVSDPFIAGQYSGKVRSLYNDRGIKIKEAGPSMPVQVVGFSGLPQAGDTLVVLESEKDTKEISFKRQQLRREHEYRKVKHLTLDEISRRVKQGVVKELSLILKGDVDGSVEAINDAIMKISTNEVVVKVLHKGVGAISESDVLLASASNAIIIGFHVRPTLKAREIAQKENVDIRLYKVIYDAISDIKDALEGLLEPELTEKITGTVEVREVFRIPKVGVVAGGYVLSGKICRNDKAKLYREDKLVYEGKINSLKRFKDDVKEVGVGFECGIGFDGFDDIKVNDVIETFKLVEVKRTL